MGKATILHVQHAFFVHFFSHHCTTRARKCQISRFIEDVNKRWRNFFLHQERSYRVVLGACDPRPCEIIVLCPYNSGVQVPINDIAKITYM